jgi:hypothetical protein
MYKTIILPVACETWSLTLSEEHRMRVFENRVLRRIFRPKRDEVTGEWRMLHNEEADQIKENEVGGTCGTHGRGEERVQGFDGKARRKETTWMTKA